jgi:hypothetical protein
MANENEGNDTVGYVYSEDPHTVAPSDAYAFGGESPYGYLPQAIPQEAQAAAQSYFSGQAPGQLAAAQAASPAWANIQTAQQNIQALPGQYQQMLSNQLMGQASSAEAAQAQFRNAMAQQGLGGLAGAGDLAGLGLQQQMSQQQATIANQQALQTAQTAAIQQEEQLRTAQITQDAMVGDQMKEMFADVVSQLFTMYPEATRLSPIFSKDLGAFSNILMSAVNLYYASSGQQGMDLATAERLLYTYPEYWKSITGQKFFGKAEDQGTSQAPGTEEGWIPAS